MPRLYLLFLLLPLVKFLQAQTAHVPVSASDFRLTAYGKRFTDPLSFTANQASLISINSGGAALYSEQRFLTEGLNLSEVDISLPGKVEGFGLQVSYFGITEYHESQFGLAYARSLGKEISLGIQFNYAAFHAAGYKSENMLVAQAGALFYPAPGVCMGFQVYVPAGVSLGKDKNEQMGSRYRGGIGYEMSDQMLAVLEIGKEENRPLDVRVGIQYAFNRQLFLKTSFSTGVLSPSGGAGLAWKNMRLDIAVCYHAQLGFTPCLTAICSFINTKEKLST